MKTNLISITDEQWKQYLVKYENLIRKISRMINGDRAIADMEDNEAELYITAMDSIRGFHKLTGKSVEEMFKDKQFDQYTKTCLWKLKARKGANLTKKMPFRNKFISTTGIGDEDEAFDIADTSGVPTADRMINEEYMQQFCGNTAKIVKSILEDPKVLSEDGKVKPNSLMKTTKLSITAIIQILTKLGVDMHTEAHESQ